LRAASRLRSTDAHTEKPAPESDDSATEARVEIIGNPRFGDGKKGGNRDDPRF
ncbi:MAG: hypothetical protein JWR75_50, partial [Devosia sp.]|nr:hypothetical protein [Devosia sp.]